MNKNIKTGYEEMVERGELDSEKIMQDHVNDFSKGAGETPVKVMPTDYKRALREMADEALKSKPAPQPVATPGGQH